MCNGTPFTIRKILASGGARTHNRQRLTDWATGVPFYRGKLLIKFDLMFLLIFCCVCLFYYYYYYYYYSFFFFFFETKHFWKGQYLCSTVFSWNTLSFNSCPQFRRSSRHLPSKWWRTNIDARCEHRINVSTAIFSTSHRRQNDVIGRYVPAVEAEKYRKVPNYSIFHMYNETGKTMYKGRFLFTTCEKKYRSTFS